MVFFWFYTKYRRDIRGGFVFFWLCNGSRTPNGRVFYLCMEGGGDSDGGMGGVGTKERQ